tara:strand:+ start:564 stop:1103 length:540 start_codon:yes stop_codon:yes gene_type:complete
MQTSERKVKDLKPYEFNSRFNEKTIDQLSKSIENYGYVVPIVIDKKNVVVTGHARLKAIKELGWQKVDCLVSNLTDEENREYRILDNKVQDLSEWNDDMLVVELRGLQEIASDFDLKVNVALETSYGSLDADVTEFDLEKQENKFETTFTDRSIEANAKLIKVSCEHCGANFGIDSEKL